MDTIYYQSCTIQNHQYVLGATEKGLAFVGFTDQPSSAISDLYSNVNLVEDVKKTALYAKELTEYFIKERTVFDCPLDVQGTSFQKAVWQELSEIPYGDTTTYGAIAKAIHRPKASQAVGNAVGQNPVPIVVPCHRVLPKSGALGGYRGGPKMKAMLLALENAKDRNK